MNDATLDNLLTEAGRRMRMEETPRRLVLPGCLPFYRARALTLSPQSGTPGEREHAAACRRCSRLLQTFEREMPHLSVWTLLRWRLDLLTEEEQHSVRYHLDQGACQRCLGRAARLGAVERGIVRLAGPLPLPVPGMVRAAVGAPELAARSLDRRLEAELVDEEGLLTLEVRTKDPGLNHHLVAYTLRRQWPDESCDGFMVLRPDVQGWFAAHVTFDDGELSNGRIASCEEVLVTPLVAALLADPERKALLASVIRSRSDPTARAAWVEWVEEAVQRSIRLSDEAWRLVCEVRQHLHDG